MKDGLKIDETTEKLLGIAQKVTGPEGFSRLLEDTKRQLQKIESEIQEKANTISSLEKGRLQLQGAKQMLEVTVQVLERCQRDWGVGGTDTTPIVQTLLPPEIGRKIEQVTTQDPEVKKRMDERKKCMWKDREQGWCSRLLKSKEAKTSGFCDVHRDIAQGKGPRN